MPLARLLAELDDDALAEFFSNNALARARGYLGRVRNIEVTPQTLTAEVQGSDIAPYRTWVRVERRSFFGERSLEISTRCNCPVGNRCKHAAALLMVARRPGAVQERPREQVIAWAQELGTRISRGESSGPRKRATNQALFYALIDEGDGALIGFQMFKARPGPQGGFSGRGERWSNYDNALVRPPAFVDEADLAVFRILRRIARTGLWGTVHLNGAAGAELLDALLGTGRAYIAPDDEQPLRPLARCEARAATLDWQPGALGLSARVRTTPGGARVLRTEPLWFLDAEAAEAGPVHSDQAPALRALLELPPLLDSELPVVAAALAESAPGLQAPDAGAARLPSIDAPPEPVLTLDSMPAWQIHPHRGYPQLLHTEYDFALAEFRYGEASVPAGGEDSLVTLPDGRAARVQRRPEAEAAAMGALEAAGFAPTPPRKVNGYGGLPEGALGLHGEADWRDFFATRAPALRAAGWRIECTDSFRHYVLLADEWFAELEEGESGWFALTLGIEVNGERMDLAPLLHELFRRDPRWLDAQAVATLADEAMVELHAPDGARILVPAGRIKPLAATLVDLFDKETGGARRISALDAPRLQQALDESWRREGFAPLEAWHEKLAGIQAVQPVEPPAGLGIELRPYQREGLAWLQHLRAHELGGVLADDMGLGKTAQTLAHLLVEKEAGRLDRPVLVVLPTSLVFNWQREAARFAPALRVLKLHGKERAQHFESIADHDVCLTTYPLLWRDIDALAAHEYHYLILDEAQTVKNAASKSARAVRKLTARHRLCLTGTPLENHLGELWSQFDFLLPGFLGASADFTRRWRTPIEKRGDTVRRELLARRLAPFILRRTKEHVATELPPKTEVLRSVQLEGRQRDLYETVRAAMDKKVREALAARGLARSRIQILEALLKLRQVCCDPRLLKSEAAAKVKEGAKLELLMQMLPELVEEGRRVLVFSQFTEMLSLIEAELAERGIDFVKLTGQTTRREQVVERFQGGAVPVFLVSLKAGGVGLNLTAADTVIHYDPWWNPAAEEQATDRAHRIGQDKPVFVYKLVVEGSIEEKIVELQARKAGLAAGILGEDAAAFDKFGEEDLGHLLAPLPVA